MLPKVSVGVLSYNFRQYLAECLESILSQKTDFPFEVIVGDDASTDRSQEVIRRFAASYPDIVRPVLRERNVGAFDNYCDVISRVKGEYIAYIDGDDRMLPGKLQKEADYLDEHPDCAIVCHDVRVFDGESGKTLFLFGEKWGNGKEKSTIDDLVGFGTFFHNGSKMFRTTSLPEDGIDRNCTCVGDWLLHIQNARKGYIHYINEVLGEYRIHSQSWCHNLSALKRLKDHVYTLEKAGSYGIRPDIYRRACALTYREYAFELFDKGHDKEFTRAINASVAKGMVLNRQHRLYYYFRYFPQVLRIIKGLKAFCKRMLSLVW